MRLSSLIRNLPENLSPIGDHSGAGSDPLIRGIAYDSRKVSPGDLFVALPGAAHDGHDYIERAIELGAVAVLAERNVELGAITDVRTICVPNSRRAMAILATAFFGVPSSDLDLVGITGTNGKTSTSYLTESILTASGRATGLIGTVEVRYAGERVAAVNTTPESLDLQRTLRAMATHGISSAVLEVSSHGLELGRVAGCRFKVGAFTNLTQDHLDFHGDMDSYLAAKTILFRDLLSADACAVLNVDDPHAEPMARAAQGSGARVLRCSRRPESGAEIVLMESEVGLSGTRARVTILGRSLEMQVPLLGEFNLENLLVACGIAAALEIDLEQIRTGVEACPQVPGRIEVVRGTGVAEPTVIVDYAHTPDAIEKLLSAVRPLANGRIITVFGCGGDRDRAKRPLMAEAVARRTDLAIATSDNPRTEDPAEILRDVEVGLQELDKVDPEQLERNMNAYAVIENRHDAIDRAIRIAEPGDTVVLAGKGHEDYQIIGLEKRPFDDRLEARNALARLERT